MSVKSVLINKKKYSLIDAVKWVLDNNYKIDYEIDETDKYYRFRQYTPRKNANYITKKIKDGIKLVVEIRFGPHEYNYV